MNLRSNVYAPLFFYLSLGMLAPDVCADEHATKQWQGSWQDGDGGLIAIHQELRYLTVTGKDEHSAYTAHCLLDPSFGTARCQGNGLQFSSGKRFLYRTEWKLAEGRIMEHWVAEFADQLIEGDLVFNRLTDDH